MLHIVSAHFWDYPLRERTQDEERTRRRRRPKGQMSYGKRALKGFSSPVDYNILFSDVF